MNIEEKAKAYDEALALAKRLISNNCTEVEKLCLKCVFPELKESEDEEIRKVLVNFILYKARHLLDEETEHKFIAYLEKQKEQKPVEGKEYTSPDCGTSACCDDECFEIIAQAKSDIIEKTNIAENALSMELPLLDGILMRVWQVGWLNKKPAEWSEDDEEMLNSCISSIEESKENRYAYRENDGDTSYDREISWLKSLPERFNLQPKQEWSDDIIRKAVKEIGLTQHQIDWFKTNVFPPKQEWSEEDENKIESIKGLITTGRFADTNTIRTIWELLDSLRPQPHWKPSDEQLRPLEYAIDYFKKKRNDTTYLESLYNDLKKL